MKKITGRASVRPLGCYKFEFFVDDNATKEEIEEEIDRQVQFYMHYNIEEGYEAMQETIYRKKSGNYYDD